MSSRDFRRFQSRIGSRGICIQSSAEESEHSAPSYYIIDLDYLPAANPQKLNILSRPLLHNSHPLYHGVPLWNQEQIIRGHDRITGDDRVSGSQQN